MYRGAEHCLQKVSYIFFQQPDKHFFLLFLFFCIKRWNSWEEWGREGERNFKRKQMGLRWRNNQQQLYSKWGITTEHVRTKRHTHMYTHTWKKQSKALSLSPHLLPANAIGLRAGSTCQSHTHTQTSRHTHIPSAVCQDSMMRNWLWWHADNKQTDIRF